MSLPDHLRKTYMAVVSRGECSATTVSTVTGRGRAIESNYLNQLSRMCWLRKRRISKTTHFRVVSNRKLGLNAQIAIDSEEIAIE